MTTISHTDVLPVMEAFPTLQGEGFHTGTPAYFVRLGGCDVGCHWCDVKDSWNADDHPSISVTDIIQGAKSQQLPIVVVTGGEPLMYNLDFLCQSIQQAGLRTHIETSGCHPFSGSWDWVCFSPKKFKAPLPEIYHRAHELKIVIFHPSDLAWAEEHAKKVSESCELFLQPEWSKADTIMPLMVDYIKENPHWRMSLQTHKYLNIP